MDELLIERDGPVLTLTLNRPDKGNMITPTLARSLADALRDLRDDRGLRAAILTGAGDRFFCIGGEHDELTHVDHSVVLPLVDVYELLDTVPKPVVAAVNGMAVGGGQVLQMMCDLSVASETAMFRQVGPLVGSFDAGYGTWYLEEAIGRRRAKELWYLNRKYTAAQARELGLVNDVVAPDQVMSHARAIVAELLARGPQAIAALKVAFAGKHLGVLGQSRMAHDQLLTHYLRSAEGHEMSTSFKERRAPDPDVFWR